ncbi:MAG TPA: type II toxin-antitoxin system PemK/MazF family toxin [Vicinamibacterales bacterium]|nr:type II toxin-antitoxin system PemK/MazF family toxin [Vicinamibacterales bacterium]
MKRGDLVVVAARGAYTGKPRPALVVQSDLFNDVHASLTICPVTSDVVDAGLFRIPLPPGSRTGLGSPSQVMVDKIVSVPRASIGRVIGHAAGSEMEAVTDALARWLDI